MAEHAFWLAKSEAEKEEFTTVSPDGDGVFCIAKQMDHRNQDISGENCVCNDAGELVLADENKINAWVEHNSRLLNVELTWSSNELPEVPPITAPTHTPHTPHTHHHHHHHPPPHTHTPHTHTPTPTPVYLQHKSAKHSAKWNAATLPALLASLLRYWKLLVWKELGWRETTAVAIFSSGVIPSNWQESFILNLYKSKGEALDRSYNRGLKLIDQVMKLLGTRLLHPWDGEHRWDEVRLCAWYHWHPFIARRLQGKYFAAKKPL